MKNVSERDITLKKCIVIDYSLFKDKEKMIFGSRAFVEINSKGLCVYTTDEHNDDILMEDDEVYKKLSAYFDVMVDSIHANECKDVWITYTMPYLTV